MINNFLFRLSDLHINLLKNDLHSFDFFLNPDVMFQTLQNDEVTQITNPKWLKLLQNFYRDVLLLLNDEAGVDLVK